jgi:hypothetical protein
MLSCLLIVQEYFNFRPVFIEFSMKKLLLLGLLLPVFTTAQPLFDQYFYKTTLRFDFLLAGNATETAIYPQQMKQEPFWAGPVENLIDTFNYGTYRFRVLDADSRKLLFSRGFSTLFQEWQTTAEAKRINRSFYQAVFLPFPKNKVTLEIEIRTWEGDFKPLYTVTIDPEDYFILKENPYPYPTEVIQEFGNPENKVDLVILAEGYTREEMDKFMDDAHRVTGYLFEEEPFKSRKENFNVRTVLSPSPDSGTDVPGEGIYKNTLFNSTFYTFDVSRYLTTSDMKSVYDAAATVPYDQIYVLVNTKRYGGGGFYNFLNICSSGHALTKEVFVHEFGHGFAGLGDEYYNSEVAYENFYNLETEPWEPNITTLVDFSKKWKAMVAVSTPVPTPRAPEYALIVGAYEGGGYTAKGIYSPFIDCRMKSNDAKQFCPVCTDAINRKIDFYTK